MAANSVDSKDINFGQFIRLFGNVLGYEGSRAIKKYADKNNHPRLSQFADRSMNDYMGRGRMVIQQAKAKANAERAYKESGYNPNSKRSSNSNQSPSINTASYSMRGVTPRQPSGNLSLRQNIAKGVNNVIEGLKNIQIDANKKNNQTKLKGTTVISPTKYGNRTPVNPSNNSKPVTKTTPKPATKTATSNTPKKGYTIAPIKDRNGKVLTQKEIEDNARYDDAVLERMTQLHNIGKDKDESYLKANFDSNNRLIGTSLQHPKQSKNNNPNNSNNSSSTVSSFSTPRTYRSRLNIQDNPNQYTPTIEPQEFNLPQVDTSLNNTVRQNIERYENGNLTPESLDMLRNDISGLNALDASGLDINPQISRRDARRARRRLRRE